MERRSSPSPSPSIVVVCVVLGLLMSAHQSEANFKKCYKSRFFACAVKPKSSLVKCAFKVLKSCIFHGLADSPAGAGADPFCTLRCSAALCAHISTKAHPGEDEVSKCVDLCSGRCSNSKH